MFFARFHCPECGTIFRLFGVFLKADAVKPCPKCNASAPMHEEDIALLSRKDQESCERG